jgi:hypothetical protein
MSKAKKTLRLPRARDLESNDLKSIQNHLKILYEELDRAYRLTFDDIAILQPGTAVGQILYWDGFKWINTETSELVWNDISKTFSINEASPNSGAKLQVGGTIVGTRSLMGGVLP